MSNSFRHGRRRLGSWRGRVAFASAVVAAGLAALALASTPASGGATSSAARKLHKVAVGSNYYAPSRKTVRRGDRVRWIWERTGGDRHDVNVKSGPERFHSPTQASGTYARTFRRPGTFKLYCSQHPMSMTLKVRR